MARRVAPALAAVVGVVALAVAGAVALRTTTGADTARARAVPTAADDAAHRLAPVHVARAATVEARPACGRVRHGFVPRTVGIPGVTRGARVVTPPRDSAGVPGTPALTSAGKEQMALDLAQGVRPGDRHGNVLLNAHAWPDGSALGNRMVAALHRGDRVVVRGAGTRLCYRVTERVVVDAAVGLPRYYARHGRPQLALLTCSGRRLGPGVWTQRTVWFASPTTTP